MPTVDLQQSEAASVAMSQIVVIEGNDYAHVVLGSCAGLVLHHAARRMAAVAHIVLPDSQGRSASPGKFADTAVPHMLNLLAARGAGRAGLVAKLAGGSSMFGNAGPIQIGKANIEAVVRLLREHKIPLAGQHCGGGQGRRIIVDAESGTVEVEIVGLPTAVL